MELKEWLDLLAVPGIFLAGCRWLRLRIRTELKTVRDEAKTAHDNIRKNIGQAREDLGQNIGQVREDVKRVESRIDELAKETRALHRAVGQLEGTVGRVGERDP